MHKLNQRNSWGIQHYIYGGIALVLSLYLAYIVFFVMLWGVAIGCCVFLIMTIKKKFLPGKQNENRPVTIEHNNDWEK